MSAQLLLELIVNGTKVPPFVAHFNPSVKTDGNWKKALIDKIIIAGKIADNQQMLFFKRSTQLNVGSKKELTSIEMITRLFGCSE